ncbi:hypothetical protein CNQ36_14825 [Streptomyces fungicidicus]|uniref:Uncharacterized protein n=1 Tax=Streptomyces fungicidicus TaxID=68203 RepID=A0A494V0U1_9ACTN|nr:hypothetical protein CNQ36_14825 [Streptomyces fungicidicus]
MVGAEMTRSGRRDWQRELEAEVTPCGEVLAGHAFVPGVPGTPPKAVDDWARGLDAYDAASRALHRRRQNKDVQRSPEPRTPPDRVGLPFLLSSAAATLYLIPGRLLMILLS